jgi:hypothetical protein
MNPTPTYELKMRLCDAFFPEKKINESDDEFSARKLKEEGVSFWRVTAAATIGERTEHMAFESKRFCSLEWNDWWTVAKLLQEVAITIAKHVERNSK